MPLLTIRVLGELAAVDHRGNTLTIGSRRTQAAMVWLALHPESGAPLEEFSARFGGDPAPLARDLRHALRFLPDLLEGDGASTRFRRGEVETDAVRFARLASGGSIQAARQAADLYRGAFLDGFTSGIDAFDEWVSDERLIHRNAALGTFAALLSAQIKAGWWEAATETASRLLALDPSQEVVHRTLMRLHLDQGRADSALRRYQECADVLLREAGRVPSAETERLREEIAAALKQAPAPRDAFQKPLDRTVLILLVEDDAVSSALMEGFLHDGGYEVVCVADGADALLELGRRRFDLLLLDVNVPTLDGLQLFEIMIQKGIETPAVFVTGAAGPAVEARSLEMGAADFLRKPIRREVLLPRVRSILQRRARAASAHPTT
jgi:CheY-like chemotaxis protein